MPPMPRSQEQYPAQYQPFIMPTLSLIVCLNWECQWYKRLTISTVQPAQMVFRDAAPAAFQIQR